MSKEEKRRTTLEWLWNYIGEPVLVLGAIYATVISLAVIIDSLTRPHISG